MASNTFVVRDFFRRLAEDKRRRTQPFSDEVAAANAVLFHPFSTDADRQEALALWFQRHQPCLFGRVAAANNALHYVFLYDEDLRESDQHIAARIQQGRREWRQRSISPYPGISAPAHGLIVSIVSQRVTFAEPNEILRQFAQEFLNIWGCRSTTEPQGQVHWEDLFLENPHTREYVRFSFSVDFFAAAGDGRWWQDHRVPGGIAFTANSVGHMRRYREWYEGKADQSTWILETAMKTIARAANTQYGSATWLRPLIEGRPFVPEIACPVVNLRPELAGYDWTRYAGHLHTDHAVRPEFFRTEPDKPAETKYREWVQDFQYLYDQTSRDHARFAAGEPVSKQEVEEQVGPRTDYVSIVSARRQKPKREAEAGISDSSRRLEVESLLDACRSWKLTPEETAEIEQ